MNVHLTFFASIILMYALMSDSVYGHGALGHDDPKDDSFGIASAGLTEEQLELVNQGYLDKIKPIFQSKCLVCHGGGAATLPWYYVIPGARQLIDRDIRIAKEHMDMSEDFPFGGHGQPIDDLNALEKSVLEGTMPLFRYRALHWNSGLTELEKMMILKWVRDSRELLKNKWELRR